MKKLFGTFVILLTLSSCNYFVSRDNYDPYISDEESCRELLKINYCLDKGINDYFHNMGLYSYFYSDVAQPENPALLYDYIVTLLGEDKEILLDFENGLSQLDWAYDNGRKVWEARQKKLKQSKNKLDWYTTAVNYKKWRKEQKTRLEQLLYKESGDILFPLINEMATPEIDFFKRAELEELLDQQVLSIYNNLNAPKIGAYEITDDTHKDYQIWSMIDETAKTENDIVQIVVYYNEDNNREYISLCYPQE